MRATQLHTLLAAGLLSLAPVATLTSCGGGGGGNGGGNANSNGGDMTASAKELPGSISGKKLTITTNDGAKLHISFNSGNAAQVRYSSSNGSQRVFTGHYEYARGPVVKNTATLNVEYSPSSGQTMTFKLGINLMTNGAWSTFGTGINSLSPMALISVTGANWSN